MPPARKSADEAEELEEGTEILTVSEDGKTADIIPEDQRTAAGTGGEEDGEDHEDDRLAAGAQHQGRTPEERKARSEARKAAKEHKRAREAAVAAENAELKRELATLRGEIGTVRQAIVGQNMATVDQRIAEALRVRDMAEETIEAAITKQDGKAAREAIKTRDMAVQALNQLGAYKQQAAAAAQQQQPTAEPQINTEAFNRLSGQFLKDNDWIDLNADDDDTLLVKEIDASVANAGYKPDTQAYWKELQRRLDDTFPPEQSAGKGTVRPAAPQPGKPARRGPAMGGGRGNGHVMGDRDVAIPRAVREAWEQAGYWKDPAMRADMIKRYKESQAKYSA